MISSFQGANRFLSNFWPCEIVYDGITFGSTEGAYQAAKTFNYDERKKIALMKPGEAKRYVRTITIRPDWDSVKLRIMEDLIRQKFTKHKVLAERLLFTEDEELIEGNTWNDIFWGVCKGVGENHLGKILMKIRQELKDATTKNY